jgi:5-methylcytosine-specific restriction endonuclease McrA
MRWGPIALSLKDARVGRGEYLCVGCKQTVPATIKVGGRRVKNVHVDHIKPIVDPDVGFVSYDELIERMFCEADNLQVLCTECHTIKTDDEKARAKARRAKQKDIDDDDDL